jgi:hypothetical protein
MWIHDPVHALRAGTRTDNDIRRQWASIFSIHSASSCPPRSDGASSTVPWRLARHPRASVPGARGSRPRLNATRVAMSATTAVRDRRPSKWAAARDCCRPTDTSRHTHRASPPTCVIGGRRLRRCHPSAIRRLNALHLLEQLVVTWCKGRAFEQKMHGARDLSHEQRPGRRRDGDLRGRKAPLCEPNQRRPRTHDSFGEPRRAIATDVLMPPSKEDLHPVPGAKPPVLTSRTAPHLEAVPWRDTMTTSGTIWPAHPDTGHRDAGVRPTAITSGGSNDCSRMNAPFWFVASACVPHQEFETSTRQCTCGASPCHAAKSVPPIYGE